MAEQDVLYTKEQELGRVNEEPERQWRQEADKN